MGYGQIAYRWTQDLRELSVYFRFEQPTTLKTEGAINHSVDLSQAGPSAVCTGSVSVGPGAV